MKRKIAAILAADVEGYSRLVSEDEEEALRRLAVYRAVFDDFIVRAGGRVFNTAGDAILAEFGSAVEATRCAIDVQESLRTRNLGYPPSRHMVFRIGLTIGDVVEREGDLLGDGVNVAARLQGLAAPGGICVSRSVYEQVAGKIAVPFRDIGEQEVKNIAHPVHAFMVQMSGHAPGRDKARQRSRSASPAGRPGSWTLVLSGAGAAFGLAALGVALMGQGSSPERPSRTRPQAQQPLRPAIPSNATPMKAFAILARSGLLADPKTVPELYHNARVHEARGEPAAARRAYEKLADVGTDAIDPLYRYAALLRAQDSRAVARGTFDKLVTKSRAAALVFAVQFEPRERREPLRKFVDANPDYGPGHYLYAREFSVDRVGNQTLYDKRMEFQGLDRFLDLDKKGQLAAYFIDGSMLAEWLDRARRAHALLDAQRQSSPIAPTASYTRSGDGWSVGLTLPEAATKVSYRVGGTGEFVLTGSTADVDPRSGKPAPKTSFGLPKGTGATTIEVTYEDMSGNLEGPFTLRFDPLAALIKDQREALERSWTKWLAFRTGTANQGLVHYTQLVSNRCAIAKVEFGFNDAPLGRTLPLPKCDDRDPEATPQNAVDSFPMPSGAKSISMQLTYTDGSRSDTRSFKHP